MKDYRPLLDQIALATPANIRPSFGPAPAEQLHQLSALRLALPVLEFYKGFAPSRSVEGFGVLIFTISEILKENGPWGFGSFTAPSGYVPFARTLAGDGYCFDMNEIDGTGEPRIVLLSHELVGPGITADQLKQIAKPIARDLYDFLEQFLRDEVDDETIDEIG